MRPPAPAVPPDLYDEAYFRQACGGHAEWNAGAAHPQYAGYLELAGLRPGEVLVDLGTGRGELLAEATRRGAARAVGVEYSAAAVALAARDAVEVLHADVRAVPLPSGIADLVTLLDVVEHLTPQELAATLAEARRLLRPGGRVFVHTFPNRLFYDVTYRALAALRPHWPRDPRTEYERLMHVHEHTARSLRAALRTAGLARTRVWHGAMVHDKVLPAWRARRLVRLLAARRATRPLGAADLWATAYAPGP